MRNQILKNYYQISIVIINHNINTAADEWIKAIRKKLLSFYVQSVYLPFMVV